MATQAGGKLSDCKMITKCSAFSESVLAANGSGNSSVRNGLVYRFELPVATLSFDPAERPPYQQIGLIMLDLDTSKKSRENLGSAENGRLFERLRSQQITNLSPLDTGQIDRSDQQSSLSEYLALFDGASGRKVATSSPLAGKGWPAPSRPCSPFNRQDQIS